MILRATVLRAARMTILVAQCTQFWLHNVHEEEREREREREIEREICYTNLNPVRSNECL